MPMAALIFAGVCWFCNKLRAGAGTVAQWAYYASDGLRRAQEQQGGPEGAMCQVLLEELRLGGKPAAEQAARIYRGEESGKLAQGGRDKSAARRGGRGLQTR